MKNALKRKLYDIFELRAISGITIKLENYMVIIDILGLNTYNGNRS
jgi:hypothetical protein